MGKNDIAIRQPQGYFARARPGDEFVIGALVNQGSGQRALIQWNSRAVGRLAAASVITSAGGERQTEKNYATLQNGVFCSFTQNRLSMGSAIMRAASSVTSQRNRR